MVKNKRSQKVKLAALTPVHKDDDTTNKKNYRNVSLLPIVSKIFEKIMQIRQITAYVETFLVWILQRLQCTTCSIIYVNKMAEISR